MPKSRNTPVVSYTGGKKSLDYFYHLALNIPFAWFLLALMGVFFGVNLFMSVLYYLSNGLISTIEASHSLKWLESYYFSITFPIVGFGGLAPIGFGRVLSALHVFLGLLFLSSMTGLIFARFSKGKSPLVWSSPVVLHEDAGHKFIQVRVTNVIGNDVVNVTASLYLQKTVKNQRGETIRSLVPVPLEITQIPVTAFSWILSHPLTANSPLLEWSLGKAPESERLIGFIYGFDSTLGKDVYSYCKWGHEELVSGTFENIITAYEEDNTFRVKITLDLSKIDDVVKEGGKGNET